MKVENAQKLLMVQLMSKMFQKNLGDSPAFAAVLESMTKASEDSGSNVNQLFDNIFNNIQSDELYSNGGQSILLDKETSNSYEAVRKIVSAKGLTPSIKEAIKKASKKYGIDENLILSVIKQESGFNSNAVSSAGAMGLMQLMPGTARGLGVTNPFSVEQNIEGGTKYLRNLLDMYGNSKELALAAYNAGPNSVKNRNVKTKDDIYKMPRETRNYVDKVIKYYKGNL
ncbi:lytic transglycosylase domain-containing protein [Haloimpatiens sp. FM7330]|uniref:lytic transglycosylase domain-containing protein n=1 Tax=Haloimpatiens sp. FM7330 TaxID=3298610 RepID=UPI003627DA67